MTRAVWLLLLAAAGVAAALLLPDNRMMQVPRSRPAPRDTEQPLQPVETDESGRFVREL